MDYLQEPFVYPIDIISAPTESCKTPGWHHILLRGPLNKDDEHNISTIAAAAKSEHAHDTGPECSVRKTEAAIFIY